MKLFEVAGKPHTVAKHSDGKKVFSGDRAACVKFIKGFDKASDEYVDLRLFDDKGDEVFWHTDGKCKGEKK